MSTLENRIRLEYFKNKIKEDLQGIRDDLGELRYRLYIAMVDECDDYRELKEMAELEMQLQFMDYAKSAIKQRLKEDSLEIEDLQKVTYPQYDAGDEILEDNDLDCDMQEPENLTAMANALNMRLQMTPESEEGIQVGGGNRLGQGDLQDLELTADEELGNQLAELGEYEEELAEQYGEGLLLDGEDIGEEDDYEEDDDYWEDGEEDEGEGLDEDDYFMDADEFEEENTGDEDDGTAEGFDEDDYFIDSEEDSEDGLEEDSEDWELEEDDYFIDSGDGIGEGEDTLVDGEDIQEDDDEYFIEDDNMQEAEEEIDEDDLDEDDYFIDDSDDIPGDLMPGEVQEEDYDDDDDEYFIDNEEGIGNKGVPKEDVTPTRNTLFQDEWTQKVFDALHKGVTVTEGTIKKRLNR